MKISQQKGSALFISLILLFLMTIIGINALDTATSDERMALNTQHKQEVFHAAESAINLIKRNDGSLEQAAIDGSFGPVTFSAQDNVAADATISYSECSDPPPGYSVEKFAYQDFDLTSTANMANTSTRVTHTLGVAKAAPREGC